jgi:ubiquinone/menaquinone biosynthesis C-methylase UbiE
MAKDRPIPGLIARAMFRMHGPRRLRAEGLLLRTGLVRPGQRVIDVGCGPGHLSLEMARLAGPGGFVFALDIHPLAMECVNRIIEAEKLANIRGILTSDFETGIEAESLDAAFIFNAIDMIRAKDMMAAELDRILKPGGSLVIRNKRTFRLADRDYARIFANTRMRFMRREGPAIFYSKAKEAEHA